MKSFINPTHPTYPISTANRLDTLLSSEVGQKLYPLVQQPKRTSSMQVSNRNPSQTPYSSNNKIRPSPSFISKGRDSPTPHSLTPSSSHKATRPTAKLEEAHSQIISVNEKMQGLETRYHEDMLKLDQRLTPQRRKQISQGIKESNIEYQELKNNRLKIIKRSRLMKNEYPKGFSGFEIYYWKEEKIAEAAARKECSRSEMRMKSDL